MYNVKIKLKSFADVRMLFSFFDENVRKWQKLNISIMDFYAPHNYVVVAVVICLLENRDFVLPLDSKREINVRTMFFCCCLSLDEEFELTCTIPPFNIWWLICCGWKDEDPICCWSWLFNICCIIGCENPPTLMPCSSPKEFRAKCSSAGEGWRDPGVRLCTNKLIQNTAIINYPLNLLETFVIINSVCCPIRIRVIFLQSIGFKRRCNFFIVITLYLKEFIVKILE